MIWERPPPPGNPAAARGGEAVSAVPLCESESESESGVSVRGGVAARRLCRLGAAAAVVACVVVRTSVSIYYLTIPPTFGMGIEGLRRTCRAIVAAGLAVLGLGRGGVLAAVSPGRRERGSESTPACVRRSGGC